jgi:hypothetical protein
VPKFKVKDGRELKAKIVEVFYIGKIISGAIVLSSEHQDYKWATNRELQKLDFADNSRKAN